MKLTKAQIKGKQEELGRAQAPAALGGGATLPPGVGRCYPPTSTLQPPGVFRPRPLGGGGRPLAPRSQYRARPLPHKGKVWYNAFVYCDQPLTGRRRRPCHGSDE